MMVHRWLVGIACIYGAAAGVHAQECLEWTTILPSQRFGHATAYDTKRQVTVMFGGYRMTPFEAACSETWEWDGERWMLRTAPGPSPRGSSAMAYDSARGVTVLFGGSSATSFVLGDTWEWDGHAWSLRSLTGPSPRYGHAMAYDPSRGVTVLSGGGQGTWEWTGQQWLLRTTGGPSSISEFAMVYDSVRNSMIALADYTTPTTWEYHGATGQWTALPAECPPPRFEHAMAYDTARGVAVMHGGLGPPFQLSYNDTWEWRSAIGEWVQVATEEPSWRRLSAMAYDVARQEMVLFGGRAGSVVYADTWVFGGAQPQWTLGVGGPVLDGSSHMAFDSLRGVTVLFTRSRFDASSETWEWDGEHLHLRATTGPIARYGGSIAYDANRGVTVLFGGTAIDGNGGLGDTWEWEGRAWTQVADTGPAARQDASMTFDEQRGVVRLFGGKPYNQNIPFADFWHWDGVAWTLLDASPPPPPRWGGAMAFDARRGVTVLFSGFVEINELAEDLWEFDGETWVQAPQSTSNPRPRVGSMAYDNRRQLCTFVGTDNAPGERWWDWDGAQWTPHSTAGLVDSVRNRLTYDAWRGVAVCLAEISPFNNVFQLVELAPPPDACEGDVDLNGIVDINDLLAVVAAWGPCPLAQGCYPDLNFDEQVSIDDLLLVIAHWSSAGSMLP